MKILVACEYSGIVRDAFTALGHDAISCDLLPTETEGKHYQGNVMDIINDGFDLMIAHPPCTYLSFAGNGYFQLGKYGYKALDRWGKRIEAMRFFYDLWNAPVERICLENPMGFPVSCFQKATQKVEPYYFGDNDKKGTHLWLKNLPPLQYSLRDNLFEARNTLDMPKPLMIDSGGKKRYFTDAIKGHGGGYFGRQKARSKSFPGIAAAMASQWSEYILKSKAA